MQQSKILSLFAVCVVLAFASVAFASGDGGSSSATAPLATTASTSALIAQPESRANMVASGIAQITGLAISPLIVLVAIGWADFFGLGGSNATQLPLHANPWFLVPCSIVLTLALLKKIASPAIPLPVRKLLDACEYFEAKLSALVAAGVLLPTLISTMAAATGAPDPTGTQTAAFFSGTAAYVVLVPVALLIFGSVWITFHVIDALIVLSPFAIVDTMLVALRGAILGVLGLAFLVSPYLALAFAIPSRSALPRICSLAAMVTSRNLEPFSRAADWVPQFARWVTRNLVRREFGSHIAHCSFCPAEHSKFLWNALPSSTGFCGQH
jgi:MFS family permease